MKPSQDDQYGTRQYEAVQRAADAWMIECACRYGC